MACPAHQTDKYSFWNSRCGISFGITRPQIQVLWGIVKPETRMTHSSKKGCHVRNQNRTKLCPYTIDKRQVGENHIVLRDVLLIFLYVNTWTGFLRRSSRWRTESLNLQLLSSVTLLGADRSTNWLFVMSAREPVVSVDHVCFQHFLDYKCPSPFERPWCEQELSSAVKFGCSF